MIRVPAKSADVGVLSSHGFVVVGVHEFDDLLQVLAFADLQEERYLLWFEAHCEEQGLGVVRC